MKLSAKDHKSISIIQELLRKFINIMILRNEKVNIVIENVTQTKSNYLLNFSPNPSTDYNLKT